MKKLMCVILALAMIFCATACGKEPTPGSSQANTQGSTEQKEGKFTKTVNFIVPFAPGSQTEGYAQAYANIAEKITGQKFVIVNKPGGSTGEGMNYLKTQPADGHSVCFVGASTETGIACGQLTGITEDSFVGIAVLCADQGMVATYKDSPFNNMTDVIEYAKANPGKLRCGGAMTMSFNHFFVIQLMRAAGVDITYVPYDSAADTSAALLGKNIDIAVNVPGSFLPYVESGDFKLLGQGLENRAPSLPDVPTVYETPGLEYEKFGMPFMTPRMMVAKAGTSPEMLAAWDKLTEQVVATPEWAAFIETQKVDTSIFTTSAGAEKYIKSTILVYRDLYESLK